jgi:hypothetical protein
VRGVRLLRGELRYDGESDSHRALHSPPTTGVAVLIKAKRGAAKKTDDRTLASSTNRATKRSQRAPWPVDLALLFAGHDL